MHEDSHPLAPRRRAVWAMLIAAALALHVALLGAIDAPAAGTQGPVARALYTRIVVPLVEVPAAIIEPVSTAAAAMSEPAPRTVQRERRSTAQRSAAMRPAPAHMDSANDARAVNKAPDASAAQAPMADASDAPRLLAQAETAPAASADSPTAPTAPASAAAAAAVADTPIPHYRTQMPGPATLRYQLARGMLHGTGELRWKPDGDRYEARLEGKLGSMTLLTQISSGGFDADGIAPERFTDWRVRRSTVAANFQRPAGKVTFSGAEQELPLQPGMQDRVSWMVQLAAIVAAQPSLRNPGAKIVMHIVGAHGDASVWTFHYSGRETVQTGLGPVATIKYARESEGGAYDTRAAAWLDAAHHYLPARATMRSGPNDDGFELLLEGVDGAP